MKDTCGRSLPLPSMRFDLESSSWRTCEATSLWDLEMSSPSFSEWGMTRGGELFALPTPVRPTVVPGSSSLLGTPTTMDSLPAREGESYEKARKSGGRKNRAATGNLREQVIHALPTPHAGLGERGRDGVYPNPQGQQDLQHAISALLPTPKATNNENQQSLERYGPNLGMVITDLLPTPTVMDMGSNYTPEEWEAWKLKQKEAHRNGNGHGASLTQEALSIGASIQGQFFDGSESSEDQHPSRRSPE